MYSLVFLEMPLLWLQTQCHSDHTFPPLALSATVLPDLEQALSALLLLTLVQVTVTAPVGYCSGLTGLPVSTFAPEQSVINIAARAIL